MEINKTNLEQLNHKLNIRVGNIELRYSYGIYEVVKWEKNNYYGREGNYEKICEGENTYYLYGDSSAHISPSCFQNPESCFTLGSFVFDSDEMPDFRTIGDRPYKLEKKEFIYYNILIDNAFKVFESMEKISEEDFYEEG
jgi:hypothetical protein